MSTPSRHPERSEGSRTRQAPFTSSQAQRGIPDSKTRSSWPRAFIEASGPRKGAWLEPPSRLKLLPLPPRAFRPRFKAS
jgi:hypothetical protein